MDQRAKFVSLKDLVSKIRQTRLFKSLNMEDPWNIFRSKVLKICGMCA